ncbi:hypothetical protein T01_6040 [Trichinella spiralis]|uniref:Uncharacterized protein n=1 Tax=Trichinella spiralis TaxID=6334 RepID=A0A0V1BS66_TRISP|nr:hypothetical protein T01_6040 [Trichinella spiralis]
MIDHRVNFPFHTQLPFEIRLKLLCSDENLSNLHKTLERRAVGLRTVRLDRKRLQIRFQSPPGRVRPITRDGRVELIIRFSCSKGKRVCLSDGAIITTAETMSNFKGDQFSFAPAANGKAAQ